ncbi:MAG: hypothetical protein WCP93_00890 [Candidatus Berkelbacteria bacterium]
MPKRACSSFRQNAIGILNQRPKPLEIGGQANSAYVVDRLSDQDNDHFLECRPCKKFVINQDRPNPSPDNPA